jgi:hypothetical protein
MIILKPAKEWSWIHNKIHVWCINHQCSQLLPDWIIKLLMEKRIGRISHAIFQVTGGCLRYDTSWGLVSHHTTYYKYNGESSGMFPLCNMCWNELTPDTSLPYYKRLYNHWINSLDGENDLEPFEIIELAVKDGK